MIIRIQILGMLMLTCFSVMNAQPNHRILARQIVDTILQINNSSLIVETKEDGNVWGVKASLMNNARIIHYNPAFVQNAYKGKDSTYLVYALFAHEVAHLLYNHNLSGIGCDQYKQMELAADIFAGKMLRAILCLDDRSDIKSKLFEQVYIQESNCKTSLTEKLRAIEDGIKEYRSWQEENNKNSCGNIPIRFSLVERNPFHKKNNPPFLLKTTLDEDVIEINYTPLTDNQRKNKYLPCFLVSKTGNQNFVPSKFKFSPSDPKEGKSETIYWNYKEDNYSLAMLQKQPELLGFQFYKPNAIPQDFQNSTMLRNILGTGLGVGLLSTGVLLQIKALSDYKNYYEKRDPDDPIYSPDLTRDKLLEQARSERNISILNIAAGAAVGVLSFRAILKIKEGRRRLEEIEFIKVQARH